MDIRFPYGLCGDCAENLHWVTDRFCLLCGKPLPEPENRGKGKKETESLCTDCRQDGRAFDRGVTCVWYGLLERELMQRFKYGGQAWYGEKMGQLMEEKLQREGLRADLVLPVPMYPGKEVRRGYNQAKLLAEEISRKLDIPAEYNLLLRKKETAAMSSLSGGERRGNLLDALAVNPERMGMAKGKALLLVDDVFTTGTTVESCAELLKQAGASAVYAATFAATAGRTEIQW